MKANKLNIPIQIRFSDVDLGGHVNNAVYLSYFELGRVSLMRTALGQEKFGPSYVLAKAEISYLKRLVFGDSPVCETWVEHIGNSSITFNGRLMLGDEEVAKSTVVVVHLGENGKPARISEEGRKCFESYVGKNE